MTVAKKELTSLERRHAQLSKSSLRNSLLSSKSVTSLNFFSFSWFNSRLLEVAQSIEYFTMKNIAKLNMIIKNNAIINLVNLFSFLLPLSSSICSFTIAFVVCLLCDFWMKDALFCCCCWLLLLVAPKACKV